MVALWLGLLGGPVAWGAQLQVVYALAPWACEGGPPATLHLLTAACLCGSLGGGWVAWNNWKSAGGWPSATDAPPLGRARLMAALGLMTASLFSVVIVAQWLAVLMLDPCPR